MNSKNVFVKQSLVNGPKIENIRGVDVTTMLSPFDVPQSASSEFDDDTRTLILSFEYLSDEKKLVDVISSDDELVKLTLGKASNRIYEIKLVDQACTQENCFQSSVLERTQNGLEEYINLYPDKKLGSFAAVENVLRKYKDELIPHQEAQAS